MSSSKHHHTSDTKAQKFARGFLAFALALSVSLLSLFCCIKFNFAAPKTIAGIFTDEEYVASFRDDVLEYSHDLCRANMLPEDTLDSAVSYKKVHSIINAYISGALGTSEEFTKTTYEDNVESLKKDITKQINSTVQAKSLTVDKKQKKGAEKLSDLVCDYLLEKLEIAHLDALETVINIGSIGGTVGITATAVVSLVLVLIIISIGERRYRALRSVIHGVNAAGLINLALIIGLEIVKHTKTLVLYPAYVASAFMNYVNRCEAVVGVSAAVLFATALVLMATVWKLNRDSKK